MPPKVLPAGPVPREALAFFMAKGLKIGFNYDDVWREEHAVAFTVAKIMEEDVLATVRGTIERAIEEGTTFEQFRKDISQLLDNSGWSNYNQNKPKKARLRTIYDTNMRMARATGQWERVQRTKRVLPYLIYSLGPSVKHRDEHVALEGTILPVDDPFWNSYYPPSGYGCKCRVRQISLDEAEREGGISQRPAIENVEWENPKTGQTESVPKGVHPSFNYPKGDRMKVVRDLEQ